MLVERHDDDCCAVALTQLCFSMNSSSPSFSVIEFTMHLPLITLRPASMISHFDESIMKARGGHLAPSWRPEETVHRRDAIDHTVVQIDIHDHGTVFDLLLRDFDGRGVVALDESLEFRAARNIAPLADVQRKRSLLTTRSSKPDKRIRGVAGGVGSLRGGTPSMASAMALMCSGGPQRNHRSCSPAPPGEHDSPAPCPRAIAVAGRRQRVRQAGIGIHSDEALRYGTQALQERLHDLGAESAVQANGEWFACRIET